MHRQGSSADQAAALGSLTETESTNTQHGQATFRNFILHTMPSLEEGRLAVVFYATKRTVVDHGENTQKSKSGHQHGRLWRAQPSWMWNTSSRTTAGISVSVTLRHSHLHIEQLQQRKGFGAASSGASLWKSDVQLFGARACIARGGSTARTSRAVTAVSQTELLVKDATRPLRQKVHTRSLASGCSNTRPLTTRMVTQLHYPEGARVVAWCWKSGWFNYDIEVRKHLFSKLAAEQNPFAFKRQKKEVAWLHAPKLKWLQRAILHESSLPFFFKLVTVSSRGWREGKKTTFRPLGFLRSDQVFFPSLHPLLDTVTILSVKRFFKLGHFKVLCRQPNAELEPVLRKRSFEVCNGTNFAVTRGKST